MKITDEAVKKHKPTAIELLNELKCRMDNPPKPDLEELRLMCDAAIAALPHLQTGYKVKQLEWSDGAWNTIRSETVFGAYVINSHDGGGFYWSLPGVLIRRSQSVDEAKAAAQEDFERRVQECIDGGLDVAALEAKHDKEMIEVIKERDQAEAWADKLAYAIGGEGIGEHSSINNPWENALEIAETRKPVDVAEVRQQTFDKAASRLEELANNAREKVRQFHAKQQDSKYGDRKRQHFYEEKKHYSRLETGYLKSAKVIRSLLGKLDKGD